MTVQLTWPRIGSPGKPTSELKPWRIAWADPEMRTTWQPRIQRLITLSVEVEKSMVAEGTLDASVLRADESKVAALMRGLQKRGLAAQPIAARKQAGPGQERTLVCDLLVARPEKLSAAITASKQSRTDAVPYFGVPPCCSQQVFAPPFHRLETDMLSQVPSPLTLLAVLGFGPLRHSPCSLACAETKSATQQFLDLAAARDPGAASWYSEMADWDVHWSREAGLAEIRAPIFRYAYPELGPNTKLTAVPARASESPALPSMRPSVKRAVSVIAGTMSPSSREAATSAQDLRAKLFDGFDCTFAQRSRFTSVIWKWARRLRGGDGDILHIPSGDGTLLELVKEVNPRLRLFGFDDRMDAADAALRRLNGSVVTLGQFDAMEHKMRAWSRAPGRAAFVDPEYLVSIPTAEREKLVEGLARSFDIVIMYATDRALDEHGTATALVKSLGIPMTDNDAGSTTVVVAK